MYTVHQAKTNLSRLIQEAENGGEVVIARGKKPVAKLIALGGCKRRVGGSLRGKISVPKSFFKPLSAAELKRWGLK
jgi:antitoxin (DNA-binding transcriptional repressor) of toxin-antitoxin stability system